MFWRGRLARATPGEPSFVGPARGPHRHLNPAAHQFPQHGIHRAQPLELLENKPHHAPGLLVRVERQTGPVADISDGPFTRQLAPPGLLECPLPEPLPEDVQLRLGHGPLVACDIIHKLYFPSESSGS